MMTTAGIEGLALSLLLRQKPSGAFSLCFLDLRRILTGGRAIISSMSAYEESVGERLPFRPEGFTVKRGSSVLILYNDLVSNPRRRNWTIAHELGHVLLGHTEGGGEQEREADRFAAALLMPESVVRFLDCRLGRPLSAHEMTLLFPASLTACRRRRTELDHRPPSPPTHAATLLLNRLFSPPPPSSSSIGEEDLAFREAVLPEQCRP